MHEAPSAFTAWSDFYVIVGSAAAGLTGLMFVVITLIAGDRTRSTDEGISTFSSPTVVHFCVALFVSAVVTAPWPSLVHASVFLALGGAYGFGYAALVTYRMRTRMHELYRPAIDDWIYYAIVPLAAYAVLVGAAIRLPAAPAGAPFALAGATIVLIFLGIHNAWDVVTFIATRQHVKQDGKEKDA